jgi:ATP-dependent Lon protease
MPLFARDAEQFATPDRLPVLPLREVVVFPYVVMPLLVGRPASLAALDAAESAGGPGKDKYVLLVAQRSGEIQDPAASDLYRIGVVARVLQTSRLPNGTAKVLVEGVARARVTRYALSGGWHRATVAAYPFVAPPERPGPGPLASDEAQAPQPESPPQGPSGAARTPRDFHTAEPAIARNPQPPEPAAAGTPHDTGSDTGQEGSDAARDAQTALSRRVLSRFEEYVSMHRRIPDETAVFVQSIESDERRAIAIAAHLAVKHDVRQKLLETPALGGLWQALSDVLSAEIELLRLERKIDEDVRGSLFQNQREFYLQEQLRAITRELGQDDGDELADLDAEIKRRALPEAVQARAQRELRKLRRTAPMSPETTVGRNYLDWLLGVPWTERTDDILDVDHARHVLDEDHYGLVEVKDRILDYIAVLGLVGHLEGPILCFVGPPGVGKTSLGRSIAKALGRRFARMALGGVRDEAEIRGHRRTYIGALPGRILQAMRRAEVINPVILLDEVDKLGQDYRGDPAAALLEVLDPEQNSAFNDHYLEIDYDLSQVLFITTANTLANVPDALRDRMEVIRLTGYLDQEKVAIARQFLVPKQLERNGLKPEDVQWEPGVLTEIMRQYTREAGVREFERRIARVARKVARKRVEKPANGPAPVGPVTITTAALPDLLGPAPFDPDETTLEDSVGVARGLAYTAVGGEILDIEVSVVRGRGKLQLTGTLGDVMKESATAALSYARRRARDLGIDEDLARGGGRDIHVHIPAGATPKDGPSAGIAIATAIISALTGVPVRGDIAMTGEVTLRGRVLPIGGLKEKSVAAHRYGIRHVIIPAGNLRELDEFPEEIRSSITFHPVKTMDEVLEFGLRRPSAPAAVPNTPPPGRRPGARSNPPGKVLPLGPPVPPRSDPHGDIAPH